MIRSGIWTTVRAFRYSGFLARKGSYEDEVEKCEREVKRVRSAGKRDLDVRG
jgi:hypothetical protein